MTDLRVIGAGFGRTGTASTKAALELLGFGPCHHMFEGTIKTSCFGFEVFFSLRKG